MSFGITASSYKQTTGSAFADAVLAANPIMYWRLGESSGTTAYDSTSYGRNGTISGSPPLGEEGYVIEDPGTSIYFASGVFDSVNIADAAWMDTTSVTIGCLYLHDPGVVPGLHILASRYADGTADWSWFLYEDSGVFKFTYQGSGNQNVTIDSGFSIVEGITYYIVGYAGASGSGIRVYDYSGLVASVTGAGHDVKASSRDLYVARCQDIPEYEGSGWIQEVSLFDTIVPTGTLDTIAGLAVNPQPKWINRVSGVGAPNGTNSHTLTFPAASAGSMLMAVVAGAQTSTPATAGWTIQLNPVFNVEVAIITRTATGGETQLQLTHNGTDIPINYIVYEFPAGTTYVAGTSNSNGEPPVLTGLPGTPVTVFAGIGQVSVSPSDPNPPYCWWGWHWLEDYDNMILSNGSYEGNHLTFGYRGNFTRTSIDPANEGWFDPVYQVEAVNSRTTLIFALQIP